jgi:hypothetical protein
MIKGIALSRIEYGEIVKGKNSITVFEEGDEVNLPDDVFAPLELAKAVERMADQPAAPAEPPKQ